MAKNYICLDGMKPGTAYSKNSLDFFENSKYNLNLEAKAPILILSYTQPKKQPNFLLSL